MKTRKMFGCGLIAVILALAFIACSGSGGGGKSLNSTTDLKEYLDKQPANSPDKPIKVAMKANNAMFKGIAEVLRNAGKYVSLDLSGSPLTEIPSGAFYDYDEGGCGTLVGITIPNGVTSIGSWAFQGCTSLASVTIPNGVTEIGGLAFKGCASLASVTIPNSVTEIGSEAFQRCTSLASVTIPNSVTSIFRDAFLFCGSLTSVTFQGTFYILDYAFDGDLEDKYLAGGIGTYTRPNGESRTWTKQ